MASSNTRFNQDKEVNNLYITPVEGLQAMDKYLLRGSKLFDPCTGLGDMADYFKHSGHAVYTNDLNDYGYPLDIQEDFLSMNEDFMIRDLDCIVMNPPFTKTLEFLDKALELCDYVLMFNRMSVLEGQARGGRFTSKQWPLKHCDIFSYRVSCTKGVNRDPTSNAVAYAVYEFDKGFSGTPTIGWITK